MSKLYKILKSWKEIRMSKPTLKYIMVSTTAGGIMRNHEVLSKTNAGAFAKVAEELTNILNPIFASEVTSIRVVSVGHPPQRMF